LFFYAKHIPHYKDVWTLNPCREGYFKNIEAEV